MKRARQVGRPRTMSQLLEETSSRSGSTGHSEHQSAQLPPSIPGTYPSIQVKPRKYC